MQLCELRIALSWALLTLAAAVITPEIHAQQTAPEPTTESSRKENSARPASEPVALFVMLDRKSIVFPDIAANSARLSTGSKFRLFVDNSVSLHSLTGAALGAGLSQAVNTPQGFGQGDEAYGKRLGSSMARLASSNFFGAFLLASALHQDPRFFPRKEPSLGFAARYSIERIFITRNDEGQDVKNWSGLLGPLLAEGLANAYWPERDRNASRTFQRYGVDLAVRAGTNMLREYWPVLFRRMPGVRASHPASTNPYFFFVYTDTPNAPVTR